MIVWRLQQKLVCYNVSVYPPDNPPKVTLTNTCDWCNGNPRTCSTRVMLAPVIYDSDISEHLQLSNFKVCIAFSKAESLSD
jgi:hypothetical protein